MPQAEISPLTQGQFDQTAATANNAWQNLATRAGDNAVVVQQQMNLLGLSVVAKNTDVISNLQPAEAQAQVGILTSGLSGKLAELGNTIGAIQQSLKGAALTPPVTAGPATGKL